MTGEERGGIQVPPLLKTALYTDHGLQQFLGKFGVEGHRASIAVRTLPRVGTLIRHTTLFAKAQWLTKYGVMRQLEMRRRIRPAGG